MIGGVTKNRGSRPFHASFPSEVAVIRGFTRKFTCFRQMNAYCAESTLIGINFAYLLRKTLVKWYELRIQLTNQGHFFELLERDFREAPGLLGRVFLYRFIRL